MRNVLTDVLDPNLVARALGFVVRCDGPAWLSRSVVRRHLNDTRTVAFTDRKASGTTS